MHDRPTLPLAEPADTQSKRPTSASSVSTSLAAGLGDHHFSLLPTLAKRSAATLWPDVDYHYRLAD